MPVEQRRGGLHIVRADAARGRDPAIVEPAEGATPVVYQEEVGERVACGALPRRGCVVPCARRDWGAQLELRDADQREPFQAAISSDETRDEVRGRIREDVLGGAELREVASQLHDRDEVTHLDRLVDVVGHEDDRLGDLLLEP